MNRETEIGNRWCILRCSPGRTLPLAASLNDAGIEAWTPTGKSMRRQGRTRKAVKVPCPIMPTFVFARERHIAALEACCGMPFLNPHPPFSIFRHRGTISKISDAALDAIRTEERRQTPRSFPKDGKVTMPSDSGAWTGLTGIIDRVEGKFLVALFNLFGRVVEVKIDHCELPDDAIDTGLSNEGVAAPAA
jgi:hypothetical protein